MIRDQNVELNNELFSFRSYIYQRMQVDRIHIFDNGVPFFEVFCFASKMVRIATSPVRYVLKIRFFIELGLKMIQFKIQFKTKSKIFIQKNIHSKQNPKYSFKKIFIQ